MVYADGRATDHVDRLDQHENRAIGETRSPELWLATITQMNILAIVAVTTTSRKQLRDASYTFGQETREEETHVDDGPKKSGFDHVGAFSS